MITIKGECNSADVYASIVDDITKEQIKRICDQPAFADSKIKIMADCHAGAGCVIGTTMTIKDKVVPNIVGVDIGCFTGDTKVALADGRSLSFIELINEKNVEHYGYSIDTKTNEVKISKLDFPRKIKTVDKLVKITLDNSKTITCTLDHLIMTRTGSYVEAKDLQIGEALMPFNIKQRQDLLDEEYCDTNNYLPTHYVVYNPSNGTYRYCHYLADEYNQRHFNIGKVVAKYVRHHEDFNKYNNNPTNIRRVLWQYHYKLHADHVGQLSKEGKAGFGLYAKENPEFFSKAGKARANSTWNDKNSVVNRQRAKDKMYKLNKEGKVNTEEQRKNSSIRMTEFNKTSGKSFTNRNSDPLFKAAQKFSRIKKVCLLCEGNINEYTYNLNRKQFYNYPYYDNAKEFCDSIGINIQSITKETIYHNHIITAIEFISNTADVYCLTCSEYQNFALDSGIFVHNCGMLVVKLKNKHIELQQVDKFITQNVIAGMKCRSENHAYTDGIDLSKLKCAKQCNIEKGYRSIGTLGGGNHFIEFDKDDEGTIYLVIHTGSRHLGLEVAQHYTRLAQNNIQSKPKIFIQKEIERLKSENREHEISARIAELNAQFDKSKSNKEFAYVEGEDFENYLHDMKIMQQFADINRKAIASDILKGLKLKVDEEFTTVHNYIDTENMIVRKGAVSANLCEKLIIPINMRDGSLLCVGKGNPDYNNSAPHGAGRILGRKQAKETLTVSEFKKQMKGIYSSTVNASTLDESPMAYKPIDAILENILDTVLIYKVIKPIYNFKAGDED